MNRLIELTDKPFVYLTKTQTENEYLVFVIVKVSQSECLETEEPTSVGGWIELNLRTTGSGSPGYQQLYKTIHIANNETGIIVKMPDPTDPSNYSTTTIEFRDSDDYNLPYIFNDALIDAPYVYVAGEMADDTYLITPYVVVYYDNSDVASFQEAAVTKYSPIIFHEIGINKISGQNNNFTYKEDFTIQPFTDSTIRGLMEITTMANGPIIEIKRRTTVRNRNADQLIL